MQAEKWGSPEGRGWQCPALPMIFLAGFLTVFTSCAVRADSPVGPPLTQPPTPWIEDLTWTEIAAAIGAGWTRAILPTGGTEQNGPHMILGKHNRVVAAAAEEMAAGLGRTFIAPVIAFVPEGEAGRDPTGHMRWPGTLTVRDDTFEALVGDTVRSLATHGIDTVFLIGDSGGNQDGLARVAGWREWRRAGVRVIHLDAYYSGHGQEAALAAEGYTAAETGGHASLRDTSELMHVHPRGVRAAPVPPAGDRHDGIAGDPSGASAAIGARMVGMKVAAGLAQARAALAEAP